MRAHERAVIEKQLFEVESLVLELEFAYFQRAQVEEIADHAEEEEVALLSWLEEVHCRFESVLCLEEVLLLEELTELFEHADRTVQWCLELVGY